jgi:transcriptional regulator with XRE-family HTH domain
MADGLSIGQRLRQIRHARGKSQSVVAGLAGISKSYLAMIERGDRALDRRSLTVALANALDVAPNEITGSELAARPGEEHDDRALTQVRLALLAVSMSEPRGQAQPVEHLRARVTGVLSAQNAADSAMVGADLPTLIRDLHTTAHAHPDEPDVLRLLTLAHMQGTQAWLTTVGAPIDLAWQAATLARQMAERLDEPVSLAISAYGTALGLLTAGAFDLAAQALATIELPLITVEDMQLAGSLALASSLISAAQKDSTQRTAALEYATELAERTGETNMLGFGFGPSNVAVWRMQSALELGEHAEAAAIAKTVTPDAMLVRARQAVYWREYGRALARHPKHRGEAVTMLRRAELISPKHVHQHPFTRSTLAELLAHSKRDAIGRELRGMAYRAGLLV